MGRFFALALLALTGCSSALPYVREPLPAGKAVVYVYRPGKFFGFAFNGGGSVVQPATGLSRGFKIRTGKYVATVVDPGRIVFSSQGPDGQPISILADLIPGGAAFIRCEIAVGAWTNGMRCEGLPSNVAEPEITDCRKNELGD